jgi:hypothetical protein
MLEGRRGYGLTSSPRSLVSLRSLVRKEGLEPGQGRQQSYIRRVSEKDGKQGQEQQYQALEVGNRPESQSPLIPNETQNIQSCP